MDGLPGHDARRARAHFTRATCPDHRHIDLPDAAARTNQPLAPSRIGVSAPSRPACLAASDQDQLGHVLKCSAKGDRVNRDCGEAGDGDGGGQGRGRGLT
jgi:hypothetical protein